MPTPRRDPGFFTDQGPRRVRPADVLSKARIVPAPRSWRTVHATRRQIASWLFLAALVGFCAGAFVQHRASKHPANILIIGPAQRPGVVEPSGDPWLPPVRRDA